MKKAILTIIAAVLLLSASLGDCLNWRWYKSGGLQPETLAYLALPGVSLTPAEIAALDLEIKGIKSGTPLTLSSLTLNLSLDGKFITRVAAAGVPFDLNRYSGIPGVQYSVAATGVPETTAVYSGAITAGTGEALDSELYTDPSFENAADWVDVGTGWSVNVEAGLAVAGPASAASHVADNGYSLTSGALYKHIITCSGYTSGNYAHFLLSALRSGSLSGLGEKTFYYTSTITSTVTLQGIYAVNSLTAKFSAISFKKVLTPDTTGILASALTNGGINANSATYVVTVSKP